jgi:hypothetical protein
VNRSAVYIIAGTVVLFRSAVFTFWEQSYFDSNQAVIGLMAKHLAEGRAFPVFMYGQNYMLGIEAWLAAPIFLVAGASVAALKLPLLAINVAIALLLMWLLERDASLSPARAAVATLFFVLPPPGTAAQLLEASGGIVEPFLYVLLLWLTRHRPVWLGLILGVGFLHREFTIYGFASLLILDGASGALFTRRRMRGLAIALVAAAATWVAIQTAARYGSAVGPGTTIADLRPAQRGNQALQLRKRFCFDAEMLPVGLWKIATVHWPALYGTQPMRLSRLSIESGMTQGLGGSWVLLAAALTLVLAGGFADIRTRRSWRKEYDFCAYLVLVGILSVAGYIIARCGAIDLYRMRYELLSILGAVGLAAWYLGGERSKGLTGAFVVLLLSWAAVNAVAHTRLLAEYLVDPPVGGKQQIIEQLDRRGARYAAGQYRDAYVITFLTNERIVVQSDRVRILEYVRDVKAHRSKAIYISRDPCRGGDQVLVGIYFCP